MDLGHGRSGEIDLEETGVPPSAHFNERYKVLEQLAEGGHGLLDIAKDIQLNRLVAVKSIRPEYANDGKIVESFLGEARLTAQLEHPSVAPIYSLERDAECGAMHLAMKLIRGRTLKDT
jgi:serine/threonine-protein kinase